MLAQTPSPYLNKNQTISKHSGHRDAVKTQITLPEFIKLCAGQARPKLTMYKQKFASQLGCWRLACGLSSFLFAFASPAVSAYQVDATSKPATENTSNDKNNALNQAEDGFGNQSGKESIGIYSDEKVRGFSPTKAGNLRIEGMYFDRRAYLGHLLQDGSKVRVGATVNGYPFPAPTGIVDYQLRKAGEQAEFSYALELENSRRGNGDLATDVNALIPLNAADSPWLYGVSLAASVFKEVTPHREASLYRSAAVVGHLRSKANADYGFELLPFYSLDQVPYETPHAFWYTREGQFPADQLLHLANKAGLKPAWMRDHGVAHTYGLIYRQDFHNQWQLRASYIRSEADFPKRSSHVFEQLDNGRWQNMFYAERDYQKQADSYELRLTKGWRQTDSQHQVHAVWRGRRVQQYYGGEAVLDMGELDLSRGIVQANAQSSRYPDNFTERTLDKIRQQNLGLAYDYKNKDFSVNLGLMKTYYDKQSWNGDGLERRYSQNREQPVFGYWNVSLNLPASWSLYAGQTQGLEESGVAPVSATNRFMALPAIHTSQRDAGLRWQADTSVGAVNAVLGWFEVSKPHFGFSADQTYQQIGQVRHRGIETSLAYKPNPQLNLVMAAVYLDAVVSGSQASQQNNRPVGSMPLEWRAYLDYKLADSETSFDLGLQYRGKTLSSEIRGTHMNPNYQLQVGLRQQFQIANLQAQLRLQINNVLNRDHWELDSDNTFMMGKPRSYRLVLTLNH